SVSGISRRRGSSRSTGESSPTRMIGLTCLPFLLSHRTLSAAARLLSSAVCPAFTLRARRERARNVNTRFGDSSASASDAAVLYSKAPSFIHLRHEDGEIIHEGQDTHPARQGKAP